MARSTPRMTFCRPIARSPFFLIFRGRARIASFVLLPCLPPGSAVFGHFCTNTETERITFTARRHNVCFCHPHMAKTGNFIGYFAFSAQKNRTLQRVPSVRATCCVAAHNTLRRPNPPVAVVGMPVCASLRTALCRILPQDESSILKAIRNNPCHFEPRRETPPCKPHPTSTSVLTGRSKQKMTFFHGIRFHVCKKKCYFVAESGTRHIVRSPATASIT